MALDKTHEREQYTFVGVVELILILTVDFTVLADFCQKAGEA